MYMIITFIINVFVGSQNYKYLFKNIAGAAQL